MKYIALAIMALALTACETTNPDGSVTRWDAKATADVINAGFQTYDRYQRASHVIGYDNFGNPVYVQ